MLIDDDCCGCWGDGYGNGDGYRSGSGWGGGDGYGNGSGYGWGSGDGWGGGDGWGQGLGGTAEVLLRIQRQVNQSMLWPTFKKGKPKK